MTAEAIRTALETAATEASAINPAMVATALIESGAVTIDAAGQPAGAADAVAALRSTDAYLFEPPPAQRGRDLGQPEAGGWTLAHLEQGGPWPGRAEYAARHQKDASAVAALSEYRENHPPTERTPKPKTGGSTARGRELYQERHPKRRTS